MLGAALGTATSYILSVAMSIRWFCRETGIRPAEVLFVDAVDLDLYKRILRTKVLRAR
jgi:Na+-driven multidrug efflux pump